MKTSKTDYWCKNCGYYIAARPHPAKIKRLITALERAVLKYEQAEMDKFPMARQQFSDARAALYAALKVK